MNQEPTNPGTNLNTAFSNQTNAAQTNPFATGDLKGEFTSDFGTNTNAVSQIFKNNGFGGTDNKKKIILGVVVVAALAVGAYFMFGSSDSEAPIEDIATNTEESSSTATDASAEKPADAAAKPADKAAATTATPEAAPAADATAAPAAAAGAAGAGGTEGAIKLSSPAGGASVAYDESQGPAIFSWDGPADRINFSRASGMAPLVRSVKLSGATSYQFNHPYPGTWYWQVINASGTSEIRSFRVSAPARRTISVSEPAAGGSVAGTGGIVAWQGDSLVARYQVQLVPTGAPWTNPAFKFGSAGDRVALQNVAAGTYDLRVGGFSEVSGRWEWTVVKGVTVQ